MKTIIAIIIVLFLTAGYYTMQHYNNMKHDCDYLSGKFYSISFDEGTCIVGNDVIHLHFH